MNNKSLLIAGLLCAMAAQSSQAAFIPKIKELRPTNYIAAGLIISSIAAYYKFKKPGINEPLKNSDSFPLRIKHLVCRILGDFGKDEKIVKINTQTGEVIYEKVDASGLAWVLKYINKNILPIILAGGIVMKNKSYIMKTCQVFYCTFEDPAKAVVEQPK